MENNKYNGWTNYETWLVNVSIDNDQDIYFWLQNMFKSGDWTTYELSNALKYRYEEEAIMSDLKAGLMSDLLNGALSAVNWYELAEHFIEDFKNENQA